MPWLRRIFGSDQDRQAHSAPAGLQSIQQKFGSFLTLLDRNNQVLKIMGDMEEKSQGEYLFDITYIRRSLDEIRAGVGAIIEALIDLGGEGYQSLGIRHAAINADIESLFPGTRPIAEDELTVPFERLERGRAFSVGSKNANLGELKSVLGLPVPDGFAISAWAYKSFVDANNLQARISSLITSVDVRSYEQLARVSDQIRSMVMRASVPGALADAIRKSVEELSARAASERFALRSSAIGEDTHFSFAGQYHTFLNVRQEEVIQRYREVLASKFSPKAIYYFLSHALTESELAMSVGCVSMVDAAASGVIYTRDPVRPDDECMVVYSLFGLGEYLVRGMLTPDVFHVSRTDGAVKQRCLASKPAQLVLRPDGGTEEQSVPEAKQQAPSLDEGQLKALSEMALRTEAHYGTPQDIEWAIDQRGQVFLLQTRPLRVVERRPPSAGPDVSKWPVLKSGGVTACPGAGSGPVYYAESGQDLLGVPEQAVLVARHPFPGLVMVMGKISALVTEVGGVASHMATLAREFRIPTLVGVEGARELPAGQPVTVDATQAAIYAGQHPDLVEARRPEFDLFDDTAVFNLLQRVLAKIAPLDLLHPSDPNFLPENCRTLHDITRFAHQKAMEEMFSGGVTLEKKRCSVRLRSDIPLPVSIVFIDQDISDLRKKGWVEEDEIASEPMRHFWGGIKEEGWPAPAQRFDAKGFMTVLSTSLTAGDQSRFLQESYAILSRQYMIVSLHMGYHFTTVEAMCTDEVSKNYIRMQYKEGGASLDRRTRRVKLIMDILSRAGFEHSSQADFLDTRLTYRGRQAIAEALQLLGRLSMMTKQLDMALSNDAIADWYTHDFMKKLGLEPSEEGGP